MYGLFPANRIGDDGEIVAEGSGAKRLAKFQFLRQQGDKAKARIKVWPILSRRRSPAWSITLGHSR
ncbi:MAG: hypothetical protein CM1200mP34_1520 [Verrucomicrobiales bacterium]|nr:MAG: hypothetical protein CM1200mP34_1520 [Verrucomicrobiales bacterium]